jgi:hypothetical protein
MSNANKAARSAALEEFRKKKTEAGDIEAIYNRQFKIATSNESEDKDAVNAAKTLMSILGVGRPGPEKPPEAPKDTPTAATQVAPISDERIADILAKLGK